MGASSTKIWVAVMTLLALTYVFLMGGRALTLISDGQPIAVVMGIAMLAFPLLALWAIARELVFGLQAEKLVQRAISEGIAELDLELRPSGRATKESAQRAFEQVSESFDEESWSAWLALSEAYEAAGDRKRARSAMRKAISLANNPKAAQ